jgi:AraC-like DNA-binding protein
MSSVEFSWPTTVIPTIRVAGRFPLQERGFATTYRGASHALHLHGYAGEIRIGERAVALNDGDLTLSPAGVASAYDLAAPGHHWCIHFLPAPADAAGPAIALPLHAPLAGAARYVRERMAHISRLHARATAAAPHDGLAAAGAAVALLELLLWCAARATAAPEASLAAAERAAAIVDARFHEPLSAARIAAEIGLSQNYLARLFRARFGMTVPRYILQRRLEHARYLLESTDLAVARIGERVGIPDPQYFNKQTRRLLGDGPSAIRRRAQGGG